MKLLEAISTIKEQGYENVKVVKVGEFADWHYLTYDIELFSIDATLCIEIDNGTDHTVRKGKFYTVPASTFFKVSSENKTAKYIIASFGATKLYGT